MKKINMHIIPHMHWDREWYFTTEESRILLVNNLEEIMTRLETDENYKYYILDGQTAILEDYFEVKPEMIKRVEKLVQSGRFIIGPWYTQTDEIVVGAESITRNLLYGFKDCREIGVEPMKIGYLPDSFGQTEQLPAILNGFGITRSVIWRGASERHGTDKTEFVWKSLDGSRIINQVLPLGYAIGKYLPNEKEALRKRMDSYIKVLTKATALDQIILPHGHDQMPLQVDIFDVIELLKELYPEINFEFNSYEEVFKYLEENISKLDEVIGELNDGKYMRVHRTISSTRMDIKYLSASLENKVTNILEPLGTLAHSLGFEYHHGLIEHIWKEMMKNHAHDSIGCCCSDIVHNEVLSRFLWASNAIDQLIIFYKRKISDHIPNQISNEKLVVFNLNPKIQSKVVQSVIRSKYNGFKLLDSEGENIDYEIISRTEIDPGLVDRQIVHYGSYEPFIEYKIQFYAENIPATGYKTYFVSKLDIERLPIKIIKNKNLQNEFLNVEVNENGTLTIENKLSGQIYTNVLLIEEGSDDGDEYDYSPLHPEEEWILTSKNISASVLFEQTSYVNRAIINFIMKLPYDLESRKKRVLDGECEFTFVVELFKNDPVLHVSSKINNNVKDHRIRVQIPTNVAAIHSIADQQFGTIERPVYDTAQDVWEKEKWKEKPVDIYSMMTFVGLSNEHHGLSMFTKGIREYEIVGNNYDTIAITLLRGVGFLGKEEMYYRPGRPSGIKMPTPDSQMIGEYEFEFGLFSHIGSTIDANVPVIAKEYLTQITDYYENGYNAMKLNKEGKKLLVEDSLLTINSKDVVLSVIKKAEREDAVVVRLFNPSRVNKNDVTVEFNKPIKHAKLINLNEEVLEDLEINNNSIYVPEILTCQVITLLVSLSKTL